MTNVTRSSAHGSSVLGGLLSSLLLLLLLAIQGPCAVQGMNQPASNNSHKNKSPLLTLPLLPHHHVVERRLRERRQRSLQLVLQQPGEDHKGDAAATEVAEAASSSTIDDFQIDPLYQGIGTHYLDLWVGCPPQRQTVIVDTGSGDTAFPCQGCNDCGGYWNDGAVHDEEDDVHYHIDPVFDHTKSTCFKPVTCHDTCRLGECYSEEDYKAHADRVPPPLPGISTQDDHGLCHVSMAYAEGSAWFAVEAVDRAYAGGYHDHVDQAEAAAASFDLRFGCQTKVTGLFKTQLADGIAGMMNEPSAYWAQVHAAGKIDHRQFSLCFTRTPYLTRSGTGAGAMVLGGTDERLHQTPMQFAKTQHPQKQMFAVAVQGLFLRSPNAGHSIVLPDGVAAKDVEYKSITHDRSVFAKGGMGTIVDSGTTSSYFPESLKDAFSAAFKEFTGRDYHTDKDYTDLTAKDVAAFPTLILQIKAWKGTDPDGNTPTIHPMEINGETYEDSIFVTFPPTHYMKYYPTKDLYRAKLVFNRGRGFSPPTLGANYLMGNNVLFDVDNGRVGIAESDCDYLSMGYQRFNHTRPYIHDEDDTNDHDKHGDGEDGDGDGTSQEAQQPEDGSSSGQQGSTEDTNNNSEEPAGSSEGQGSTEDTTHNNSEEPTEGQGSTEGTTTHSNSEEPTTGSGTETPPQTPIRNTGPPTHQQQQQQQHSCQSLSCRFSPFTWLVIFGVTLVSVLRYRSRRRNRRGTASAAYDVSRVYDDEIFSDGFHDEEDGFRDEDGYHDTEMVESK